MKPKREQSDATRRRHENELFSAVLSLRDIRECRDFFKDLCTPAELQALVDRWQVVQLLKQGLPYRRIHDMTGVSVTTIGRVARFLSSGFGGYETAIQRSSSTPRKERASH
ncbi:MAG: helix-turn-helix domain-containing protein [Gammaproteobacteria bacterium]|nr:helix-turn-helix domain-containing protein [Gammaproteobacteria bacterium]